MSAQDEYAGRLRGLLISLGEHLEPYQLDILMDAVDHDEGPEALVMLAWYIVDGDKRVPAAAIADIRELTGGFSAARDLPEDLERYAIDSS